MGTSFQGEPSFGGRHLLILAGVFVVLFCIAVGTSFILGAERQATGESPGGNVSGEAFAESGLLSSHGDRGTVGDGHVAADVMPNDPLNDSTNDLQNSDSSLVAVDAVPDDRPLLAIVIDDWGYGWSAANDFLALDVPLNVAVIPHLPYSQRHANQAAERGHQVILHLPMEPMDEGWDLGEGAVLTAMASDDIVRDVARAWRSVPHVSGVNNHMGSKATADERVVAAVMAVVKEEGAFFLDSKTTAASVIGPIAESFDVPYLENDRFIDPDTVPERVRDRIMAAARIAKRRGWAVAIGHVQPATYAGLVAALPLLEEEGVRLARLDEVLARAQRNAHTQP